MNADFEKNKALWIKLRRELAEVKKRQGNDAQNAESEQATKEMESIIEKMGIAINWNERN